MVTGSKLHEHNNVFLRSSIAASEIIVCWLCNFTNLLILLRGEHAYPTPPANFSLKFSTLQSGFVSRLRKAFSYSVFILFFLIGALDAAAQCPPDSPGCTWTSERTPYFMYKGCDTEVRFCYRTCNGVCEVRIRQWRFLDKWCIAGQTIGDDYWALAEEQVMIALTNYALCLESIPACPQGNTVYMSTPSVCLEASSSDPSPFLNIFPCSEGTSKCTSSWFVCYDNTFTPPMLTQTRSAGITYGLCPFTIVGSGGIPIPGLLPPIYNSGCYVICD